jgi:outer membrane protein assembly factor BamB
MKKTFILLIIVILISGFLASCTGTQMQLDADSDEEIVEALKTKTSSQSESSTDETATPFSQLNDGDEILAGRERWAAEFNLPVYHDHDTSNDYSRQLLPMITESNYHQQVFYGKGYAFDDRSFYLPHQAAKIVSIDSMSGLIKWQSEIGGYVLAVGEETVFVFTGEDRIYGLDKNNGEVKWKIILELLFEDGTGLRIAPMMHRIDEKFVLILHSWSEWGNENAFWLLHVDEIDGTNSLIQAKELSRGVTPLFFTDNLFIAEDEYSNTFMGINYADGSIIWRITKPESYLDGGALYFVDMDIEEKILYLLTQVYSGEIHNVIYDLIAIDMMTGDLIWGGSIGEVNDSFGIGIFSASCDILEKYLVCLTNPFDDQNQDVYNIYNKNTGQFVNTFTPERIQYRTYLGENGLLVYYYDLGIMQGIDYLTGEILWQDDEVRWEHIYSDSYYYKDVIVVNHQGVDLAIDQRTGNHLWENDSRIFLGLIEDKFLVAWSLVDPITGEEQEIAITDRFAFTSYYLELLGNTIIISNYEKLMLIDLDL